jgi:UDP-glucose 4-epimerase
MSGTSVMVTGAAGFVGSHLTEALLARGHVVHALDVVELDAARNLEKVCEHPRLRYTCADVRDAEALGAWYEPGAETLYHLASVVGVHRYMDDPLALVDIVVGGTRTLIGLAAEHDTRLLFASTSEVYGKNPSVPWSEDSDRVLGPTSVDRWSYSSSKAVCEHMIYGMAHTHGLRFSIVRFFNVYGPRQNPIYVVSQSVQRALRGEPPLLYDSGQQTRCFTYVADVIDGLIAVATHPDAPGEVFNLGRPHESTMAEVVRAVCTETGLDVPPVTFDTTVEYGSAYEDIPRRIPAVDKARTIIGWEAKTELAEGIRQTVQWALENDWYLQQD